MEPLVEENEARAFERSGPGGVQLRLPGQLTAEQYVSQQAWRSASLPPCPMHPEGGCGFSWHTPYERKSTPGAKVARGYCRLGKFTVSLLPDCLASRLPSTLSEVERAIDQIESHVGSLDELAIAQRPAVGPDDDHVAGALRWLRRRRKHVMAALVAIASVMPEKLAGHPPTLAGFRAALGVREILMTLREVAEAHLAVLPAPLGLVPGPPQQKQEAPQIQQGMGPDPP